MSKLRENELKQKIISILILITCLVIGYFLYQFFVGGPKVSKYLIKMFDSTNPIAIKEGQYYGYIDHNGKQTIAPQFKYAYDFVGEYAIVEAFTDNDKKNTEYRVINRKGHALASSSLKSRINYINEYDLWVVDDVLYDGNFSKMLDEQYSISYEDQGYFLFENNAKRQAGILNDKGKKTYTYNFKEGESTFRVRPSTITVADIDKVYCVIEVEYEYYGIVNCETGKIIKDLFLTTIRVDDNNIFREIDDDYNLINSYYVDNNKILYETESNKRLEYLGDGFLEIYDRDSWEERKVYYNINTREKIQNKPTINVPLLDSIEGLLGFEKFSCNDGYGIKSGDKIILSCTFSRISFLGIEKFNYLRGMEKKEIVIIEDGDYYAFYDLRRNRELERFKGDYLYSRHNSPFIRLSNDDSDTIIVYNLFTGKYKTLPDSTCWSRANYFELRTDEGIKIYNNNLEHIYTREN